MAGAFPAEEEDDVLDGADYSSGAGRIWEVAGWVESGERVGEAERVDGGRLGE